MPNTRSDHDRAIKPPGRSSAAAVDSSGRVISPIAQSLLPDVPRTGERSLGIASVSDGTIGLIGWRLDPDVNGNSKLTLSTVTLTAAPGPITADPSVVTPPNTVVSQEDHSFYLDSLGNLFKMTVVVTDGGTTVTLSGNKN